MSEPLGGWADSADVDEAVHDSDLPVDSPSDTSDAVIGAGLSMENSASTGCFWHQIIYRQEENQSSYD
jgi:hypothetical protein